MDVTQAEQRVTLAEKLAYYRRRATDYLAQAQEMATRAATLERQLTTLQPKGED